MLIQRKKHVSNEKYPYRIRVFYETLFDELANILWCKPLSKGYSSKRVLTGGNYLEIAETIVITWSLRRCSISRKSRVASFLYSTKGSRWP